MKLQRTTVKLRIVLASALVGLTPVYGLELAPTAHPLRTGGGLPSCTGSCVATGRDYSFDKGVLREDLGGSWMWEMYNLVIRNKGTYSATGGLRAYDCATRGIPLKKYSEVRYSGSLSPEIFGFAFPNAMDFYARSYVSDTSRYSYGRARLLGTTYFYGYHADKVVAPMTPVVDLKDALDAGNIILSFLSSGFVGFKAKATLQHWGRLDMYSDTHARGGVNLKSSARVSWEVRVSDPIGILRFGMKANFPVAAAHLDGVLVTDPSQKRIDGSVDLTIGGIDYTVKGYTQVCFIACSKKNWCSLGRFKLAEEKVRLAP